MTVEVNRSTTRVLVHDDAGTFTVAVSFRQSEKWPYRMCGVVKCGCFPFDLRGEKKSRPDMTSAVDWSLKANYLSWCIFWVRKWRKVNNTWFDTSLTSDTNIIRTSLLVRTKRRRSDACCFVVLSSPEKRNMTLLCVFVIEKSRSAVSFQGVLTKRSDLFWDNRYG